MSQTAQATHQVSIMDHETPDHETLELRMLRLPPSIDDSSLPQIMADIDRLLEPGIGVMLDFSHTNTVERNCLKVFEFASGLAAERSATIGYMGETAEVRAILEISRLFRQAAKV